MVNSQIMHIRLQDPKEIKKSILESAVKIVQVHKNITKVNLIERENRLYRSQFKKTINELKRELNSIKIPEVEYEKPRIVKKKHKKKLNKTSKPKVYKDKFEQDISRLQSKISSL